MKPDWRFAKIIKILLLVVALLVLLQIVLVNLDISFTSDKARRVLLEQIKTLTQRDACIDGDVQITVSLSPQLLVERIHIKNVEGFGDEDFITVSEVRVELASLPLLTGGLHLEELAADNAHVNLIIKKDGSHNWSFDQLIETLETTIKETDYTVKSKNEKSRFSLGLFRLTDISIKYNDESYDKQIVNHLDQLLINFKNRAEPRGEISGSVQGFPFEITFVSDDLRNLTTEQAWTLYGTGDIADKKTILEVSVQLKEYAINGNVNINVKKVNLGLLLEEFGILAEQDAAADEAVIIIKYQGTNSTEVYQQAEISLQLRKVNWNLSSSKNDHTKELLISNLSLDTSWNMPVVLHLDGMFDDETLKFDFKVNRLAEFFDEVKTLDVDLKANVAGSDITANGTINLPIKTNQFQLDVSLKGKDLEKLNKLIDSELPPFNNYSMTGNISANERGLIIKADDASIGDTHFRTVIVIDTSSFKPFWTINLNSRQLQINDFETGEWKLEKLDVASINASMKQTSGVSKEELGHRLKQIVQDPKMHFDLNLNVEKVLAGVNLIGKARLGLKLRDDSLILEDAEIDVPGGKVKSTASFKVKNEQVTGAFKLDIDKFEYGAVARYFIPGSPQGGVIRAGIDLKLGGNNFARLFDHATGKLDVALWPRNTQSNIFDIWATNLFLVILPEINTKESRLNCLVALMDVDDGIMTEDFFGIDTTKVWMHGNINVNFVEQHVRLSLYPRSKKARLFAWQAPIRAEGSFNDIGLSTNPVDLAVAYYSFITSPLHVPARWVFGDKVPEDASAICEQLYDREYVNKLKEEWSQAEQKEIDEWLDSD